MNLLEHAKDCTPLTPCAACEIVVFLRDNLEPEVFEALLERVKRLQPTNGPLPRYLLPFTTPVDDLQILAPLSTRTRNALRDWNCITIDDVLRFAREHRLLRQPNFGRRSLTELEQALSLAGHQLPETSR